VPDKAENDRSKKPERSRRETLKSDGVDEPEMPPCPAPLLVEYLFEIGPVMAGGMGNAPLTHAEISAWQCNVGIELQPWQARMLKKLSADYLEESHLARDRDRAAPWAAGFHTNTARSLVAERMKRSLREAARL
jgi:hypothetical protein